MAIHHIPTEQLEEVASNTRNQFAKIARYALDLKQENDVLLAEVERLRPYDPTPVGATSENPDPAPGPNVEAGSGHVAEETGHTSEPTS